MKRLFVEADGFRKRIDEYKDESLLRTIQNEIMQEDISPEEKKVIHQLVDVLKKGR